MGKSARLKAERRAAARRGDAPVRSHHLHVLGQANAHINAFEKDGLGHVDKVVDVQVRLAEIAGTPITCKRGCHGCCYQLVAATYAEGLAIARYLFAVRGATKELVDAIFDAAKSQEASDKTKWYESRTPCTFLDEKTKNCTIYPVRPSACRSYLVTSDPAICYGPPDVDATVINHIPSSLAAVKAAVAFDEAMKPMTGVSGMFRVFNTLPEAVLFGIGLIVNGLQSRKQEEFEKVTSREQLRDATPNLLAGDEASGIDYSSEELKHYVEVILTAADKPDFLQAVLDAARKKHPPAGPGGDAAEEPSAADRGPTS